MLNREGGKEQKESKKQQYEHQGERRKLGEEVLCVLEQRFPCRLWRDHSELSRSSPR